jgi:hypothetical protein
VSGQLHAPKEMPTARGVPKKKQNESCEFEGKYFDIRMKYENFKILYNQVFPKYKT